MEDAFVRNEFNPIHKARLAFGNMLRTGRSGGLSPLFDACIGEDQQALMDSARSMITNFASQVEWRFLHYEAFPIRWAEFVHPVATDESRWNLLCSFFDETCDCCRRNGFDDKIFHGFVGDKYRAWNDTNFAKANLAWVRSFKFTDMHMERLLSKIRHMCCACLPEAERVGCAGFLGQVLAAHEGEDPRAVSREQHLREGVDLRCAKKKRRRNLADRSSIGCRSRSRREQRASTKLRIQFGGEKKTGVG